MKSNEEVIFREFKKIDEEAVLRLFRQLMSHKDRFDAQVCLDQKNLHCLVIEINGSVIGFGCTAIDYSPTKHYYARLDEIIVDESYRRRGLGKELMTRLITIATNHGVRLITLTSNPKRVAARKLYESLNFKIYDTNVYELKL